MFETPILLLLFNRIDTTKQVIEQIKKIKPKYLFIAADGPRKNIIGEKEKCEEVRNLVLESINWKCELKTLFRDENLGCAKAVNSAITWLFENVESGIILEDDCLPDLSFFFFCAELLKKYANDSRIGMISGNNFNSKLYDAELSYSFSRHGLIWGWATWKRAWKNNLIDYTILSTKEINLIKANISQKNYFNDFWWKGVDLSMKGNLDTWDYLWGVTRYMNNYLVIRPKVNLVANIGFGIDSTHTGENANELFIRTESLELPLKHPNIVLQDKISDDALEIFLAGKPQNWFQNALKNKNKIKIYLKRTLNKFGILPNKATSWKN